VTLDPARELMALAGSKEGLAELIMSHCSPGDVVLVPEVHYPVYARAALLVGAVPVFVPFLGDGSGHLDLDAIDADVLKRARLLIVNYPGNPTTSVATLAELERLVAFSARNKLLLVSDLAYSELSFDGFRVPSVLQVPGASKVAVELHTCSKSFNMAGLRIAFIAGSSAAIDKLDAYRSNIGYGVSTFAQLAGAAAFERYREVIPPIVDEYRARRDALVASFGEGGWDVTPPDATMYLWLDVPAGYGDWEWVDTLMEQTGIVVTPGIAFGDAGAGKFRVSLVQPESVLRKAGSLISGMPVLADR
jgi:LL-diaminopimelate aminotransferase